MKKLICIIVCFAIFSNMFVASAYNTSALSAVVIDGNTGEILYSQNCDVRLPMASTTKIMTALLLCELGGDLTKQITTAREMVTVEGSSMGLLAGDIVSYRDLLYGMMLASGNDAANTTAIAIAGSISAFVDLMNERAKQMGLVNTNFVTPSGLDAQEHYTTAYELAIITKNALNNQEFSKAVAAQSARLCYGNPPYNRTLTNHNKLLKMYDDIVGVKTGFTKKSGRCLVSASRKDGKFVIAVTLNDKNDWADHRNLLDVGLSLIENKQLSSKQNEVLINTVDDNKVEVAIPSASMYIAEKAEVDYYIKLPTFLYLPIKKGQQVGSIIYSSNGKQLKELPIVCEDNIENKQNKVNLFFEIFKSILSQI